MAEQKFSEFTEDATPGLEDVVVGLSGGDNKQIKLKNLTRKIQLNITDGAPVYAPGQIWWDPVAGCATIDSGYTGVRTCVGQELHVPVFNNTGSIIPDGTPIAGAGSYTGGVPNAALADADNPSHIIGFFGLATADIGIGDVGLVTKLGAVQGIDTSLLSTAPVYLASGGGLTNTIPTYPTGRLLVGGVTVSDASAGIIGVDPVAIPRSVASLVYNFTSTGSGAGADKYIAGSYDWNAADANLTQASTTVSYGSADTATGAHAGIVAGGAGSVIGGSVALRVTGTSITDAGVLTIGDAEVLTSDITTLSANQYIETAKNWVGIITFELVNSGASTFSLDFNYGFSAYIDAANTNFTLTAIRTEGLCGGTDTGFDVRVRKHSTSGWTYAATGFTPGDGLIASFSDDLAPYDTITNTKNFKWKRTELNEFIQGAVDEGFVISVDTTNNNAIQSMLITVAAYIESIT